MIIFLIFAIAGVPAMGGLVLPADDQQESAHAKMLKLPLSFIENKEQAPDDVKFHIAAAGHTIAFMPDGAALRATQEKDNQAVSIEIRMNFVGAAESPAVTGLDPLPGKANFFIGSDASQWETDVPTFSAIRYDQLYPGIDLVYRGTEGELKREFVIAPGINPDQIVLSYSGIDSLGLAEDGSIRITTLLGVITDEAPVAWQLIGDQMIPVPVSYEVIGNNLVGFTTGTYDPSEPLIIDPSLKYSSYLGGTGGDFGYGIATDTSGNMYLTGYTTSTDFPSVNPLQTNKSPAADIFVTKLNPSGTGVLSSTYLGGNADDYGFGIAVDGDRYIYIAGRTRSTDFPLSNATQSSNNGGNNGDTILAKLDPTGSALLFSTYLGGDNDDMLGQYGNCLAVDAEGNMYVTGATRSTNFSVVNPIQGSNAGGFYDVFVTKVDPSTPAIVYSTYLGGSGSDSGADIEVDDAGAAYVTGQTNSADFPLSNAIQPAIAGSYDAFFAKINPAGSALIYSSFLGGGGSDIAYATAVGSDHSMYLTGSTSSTNFTVVNPVQGTIGGTGSDAFVTKVNPAGSALVYSTYLGGAGNADGGRAIGVDPAGNAYITGIANGTGFPTVNPIMSYTALRDVFVTKLNESGNGITYSTYLGGSNNDEAYAMAVDSTGQVYLTGMTQSTNFPMVSPLQGITGGTWDGFVAIIEGDKAPIAGFTADQTIGPSPLTVNFTDVSTGTPTSWDWNFGDGTSHSADKDPVHTYTTPGTYPVSLTVTNAIGSDSLSRPEYIIATDGGGLLPAHNQVYIRVGNDPGAKFDVYGNNTYYVNFTGSGTGLNDLHISTDPAVPAGQVICTTAQSGTFFITNTGPRTYKDDVILMIAVKGMIPDDFSVRVRSSGFNWTPLPNAAPDVGAVDYVPGAVDETFTKGDFLYGPQPWKPAGDPNYPLLDGESMGDQANMYRILFIDTHIGILGTGFESLTDRGAAKIEFVFTNLSTNAAFNAYAYCYQTNNGNTQIAWTNRLSSTGANGFSVSAPRAPVAGFLANKTSGAAPLTVQFTDTSLYIPISWLWDFGDGVTSGGQNPEHTYTSPGTYSVGLTATNALGSNSQQVPGYITVSEGPSLPVANFTANLTEGPVPLTVQFNDTSSGVPDEWNWEFGDGENSTLENPVHTYDGMGTFQVNLTVSNTFGRDSENKTGFITANAPLPRTWTVGPTGCDFTELNPAFANALMNNGDTISILPGTYTFASGLTKSVTIHGAGTDQVTATMNSVSDLYFSGAGIVVEGINFSANSKILYISGNGSLIRNCTFNAIPTFANIYIQSANTRVENCTFQSCAVQNILVLAGNGDIVRNCTFRANTNRIIQVSGGDCLIENNIFRDNIQGSSVKGIIRMQSCANLTVTRNEFLNNTAPGGVISLKTVSTGNSIFLNNFVGNSVDVAIDTGISQQVTWVSPPIPYTFHSAPYTGSLGNFWSAYSGSDADGNGTGDIPRSLGTSQTDTAPLMDHWQYYFGATHPLASISVSPGFPTLNVSETQQFTAIAFDDTGNEIAGVSFNWSSSNTTVGTVDGNGLFTAMFAGTTHINATIEQIPGTSTVLVTDMLPFASFAANVTFGPKPLTVLFNDTSAHSPTWWFWEFGDGTNSTMRNCTHTYASHGIYSVRLTVSNTAGSNITEIADYISVNQRPVADFIANTTRGKFPLTVQFTDTSTNNPTSWSWAFGDGGISYEQHPVHTYETVANYTVTLTASNGDGSDTAGKTGYILVREINADPLPAPRHIFVNVANDAGVMFNLDGPEFGGPNNTYYIKANGGGLGAIHVSNDPEVISGQVTTTNASSGVFYITNSGGRGYDDEIILLISVRDPVPDDFAVRIRASGYQWDPVEAAGHKPTDYHYVEGAADETFGKDDLIYGPQTWKPGPGDPVIPSHPLYYGQNIDDPSTSAYLMFVDANVGNLKQSAFTEPLVDKGAVKIEYWFTNMTTHAAFNGYGWCLISNQDQGISWTNDVEGLSASGYSVDGVPTGGQDLPLVSIVPAAGNTPVGSTTQYQIFVNTVPTGLSGFNLTISLDHPAIGEITAVSIPAWAALNGTSTLPADTVTFNAVDLNRQVEPGATNVLLGTITVRADAAVTTGINVTIRKMDDDNGDAVLPVINNGQLQVFAPLVANFSAEPLTGFRPLTVNFTDLSTGDPLPAAWAWDFENDGTIDSTTPSPSHTYVAAGTYDVNLTVSNSFDTASVLKALYIHVQVLVQAFPGYTNPPSDPDHDGLYEDINGNGRLDFDDVVAYYSSMAWMSANADVGTVPYDYNHNDRIDFDDVVVLYNEVLAW